jgi:hypothetical protein
MVELVDTRDLKSRGSGRVRAGSSPAPGTTLHDTNPGWPVEPFGPCAPGAIFKNR